MSPTFKEASFPASYRQAEVAQILGAAYRSRSIPVTGLAGMGKSNVVRFIVSHPEARRRYLRERSQDFAFVYIDCAGLPKNDEDSVLEEAIAQLYLEGLASQSPALPPSVASLRRTLRAHVQAVPAERSLVLVFDDFDRAAVAVGEPFFDYLAHLRNARARGNLAYILATRRPVARLFELQELMDDGCVIGPFGSADAQASLDRDGARLGFAFSSAQRQALISCTGGHPGLLKNAAELLAVGDVSADQPLDEMARRLLRSSKIRIACEDLWGDLTPTERGILSNAALGILLGDASDEPAQGFVRKAGLLVQGTGQQGEPEERLFCPLFHAFVETEATLTGQVRITPTPPNHARVEAQGGAKTVELAPLLFELLDAFAQAREKVLSRDDIIRDVYGGGEGVSDQAISQLVKRLRMSLDPLARTLANNPSYTCVETVRGVGFRFQG